MSCLDYEAQFSDYIEDDLALEARDALRFHLSACHRCHEKLTDMQRTVVAVHSLASSSPDNAFDESLHQRLNAEFTREVYRSHVWTRLKDAVSEFADFGRQGSVQAVFSTGVVLTLCIGFWLSYVPGTEIDLLESAQLLLPESVEAELANVQPTSPIPVEYSELAPAMAARRDNSGKSLSSRSIRSAVSPSNVVPDLDIQSLLPLPSGELGALNVDAPRNAYTVSSAQQGVFSIEPLGRSSVTLSANQGMRSGLYSSTPPLGFRSVRSTLTQSGGQKFILPTVPSKMRITRVSF